MASRFARASQACAIRSRTSPEASAADSPPARSISVNHAQAAPLARDLRAAGAEQVWLAGRPELAVDGVDGYVYAGCDALEVLRTAHEQLGVGA